MVNWNKVRTIIEKCWDNQTAYPKSLKSGSTCRSRGQCYVTALLVEVMFGGEIIHGKIDGESCYWNRVGNSEVDLTSDQYGGDGFHPVTRGQKTTLLNFNNKRFTLLFTRWLIQIAQIDINELY